ncbi:hypothetical protein CT0861_00412, partial [Colletotrichum tofieldiae]
LLFSLPPRCSPRTAMVILPPFPPTPSRAVEERMAQAQPDNDKTNILYQRRLRESLQHTTHTISYNTSVSFASRPSIGSNHNMYFLDGGGS